MEDERAQGKKSTFHWRQIQFHRLSHAKSNFAVQFAVEFCVEYIKSKTFVEISVVEECVVLCAVHSTLIELHVWKKCLNNKKITKRASPK